MFTTLPALFTQLEALELSPKTRKAHTIALDAIVHELKLNTEHSSRRSATTLTS